MFGLFTKSLSTQDSVNLCCVLAKNARIEPYSENGNYAAFVVFIDEKPSQLLKHLKNQEVIGAIVGVVEDRIANGQFYEPGADSVMLQDIREMSNWVPNLNAKRVIVGKDQKPLFSWDPEKHS